MYCSAVNCVAELRGSKQELRAVKEALTLKIQDPNRRVTYKIFSEGKGKLRIPSAVFVDSEQVEYQNRVNKRKRQVRDLLPGAQVVATGPMTPDCAPFPQRLAQDPKEHQRVMVAEFQEKLRAQRPTVLLHGSTGCGKTKTVGQMLFAREKEEGVPLSASVVTPTKQLQSQWASQFSELFGSDWARDNVVVINGDTGLLPCGKITIYTMQGLPKLLKEKDHQLRSDFLVLDEVHLYRTENYNSFVFPSDFRFVIGCSATPYTGMTDEEKNQFFIGLFFSGLVRYEAPLPVNQQRLFFKEQYLNKAQQEMVAVRDDGQVSTMDTLRLIHADRERTDFVCDVVCSRAEERRRSMVFTITKDYSDVLLDALRTRLGDACAVLQLYGGNTKKQNAGVTNEINAKSDSPVVVLTTYKYSSVGLDLANMDTIVLADSTKSQIEQIIGRIGRNQSERDLHIYDIVDKFHFIGKHFAARKKVYEKKGYVDGLKQNSGRTADPSQQPQQSTKPQRRTKAPSEVQRRVGTGKNTKVQQGFVQRSGD